jgi:hypothetical protein
LNIRAIDIIQTGKTAVALFTHGDNFRLDQKNGIGESGNWKISPEALEFVDCVIVYLRPKNNTFNHIYLGDFLGYRKSEEPDRLIIRFARLYEIDTTDLNWIDFSGSGQNPVCIISK